jgi:hypothetical protein
MEVVMFQKAEKKQGKLRIALTGPSGSGKTMSALLIAQGIIEQMRKMGLDTGKGIAVIDTENGSAADYADRFEFDFLKIDPPYTIQKYMAALKDAYEGGYAVVDIDSISHAWAGEGGLLQKKEQLDSRGGNQYTNWAAITKEHEQFKGMILSNKIHLIATMRSKQDYVLEQKDGGKLAPKKVGMAPIQRDGMEYEFTTVLDLGMDHSASASKDRTGIFDKQLFIPTVETGKGLLVWRMSGKEEKPETPPVAEKKLHEPAQALGNAGNVRFIPHEVKAMKRTFKNKPDEFYFLIFSPDGVPYETPNKAQAETAKDAGAMKFEVELTYVRTEKGYMAQNVVALTAESAEELPLEKVS